MKCFLCFVLIVLLGDSSANHDVEMVEAVVGHTAELPCNVTSEIEGDKLNIIAWYKNGSSTAFYSRDFRNQNGKAGSAPDRYRMLRSGTEDTDVLQIASVRPADAGVYICHVDFDSSPSHKTYVQVTVIDPPQRLYVIHENGTRLAAAGAGSNTSRSIGPYYVGDTVHLFCVSFGGKPQPSLSWRAGRRLLKESWTQLSEQRVRSDVLYGPLEREDHGLPLTCAAANNNRSQPLAIDLIVDMHLSPLLISVRSASNRNSAGRARAGEPLGVQCRVLGARPAPDVEWRLNDARLVNLEQNITTDASQRLLVSEVQLSLGPEHDEARLTCCVPLYTRAAEDQALCAAPFPITVRYKPIVQIVVPNDLKNTTMAVVKGSDVVMNCSYDANPDPHVLVWYFQDDVLVKYHDGDITPTLTLSKVSDEQAGEYGCEVGNAEGTTYSGENVVIDVIYPAYCEETDIIEFGLGEDEFLNITCNVKGNPPPTQYRWVLVNDSVTVNTIRNTSQTTVETEEPTLLYQRPSGTPFTTVFCWGLNGVPSSGLPHTPCISLITDETPPRSPTDCVATRVESKDITITCEKGYNGGLPQHFKFVVKPIDDENHQEEILSITKMEPNFLIQEPSEEKYKFVILAINDKGESSEVEIAMEDIVNENPEVLPKSAIANITTLALALCGGVALVALAACGLVLCAHERGSRDLPRAVSEPPLCAYNTEESNCDTFHGSDDGSECNVRRTDSFRRAVSRYPSRNFDVRRTSSFHSARYMNDMAEQEPTKCSDVLRHSASCRVHSLQNINKKRDMDMQCDHLVMHLPSEVNYNVPRPMNTFYTMPRKMRQKLAKELSDEASEITQTSDGFSLPPPPDEYGTYRAGTRIKDMPTKSTPTYSTVVKKSSGKEPKNYNNVIISPMNTVGLPTVSAHAGAYSYPDDEQRPHQNTTGILTTFQGHISGKESGL
ncbi:roundabout homolog 3-like isoform X2 [Ostrinia furnacalis]|uniref:roundabout homolog 3-like isoform X2 n=1 Tax=Ostrinia furnacalis TaxID=93504 RepID=UPI0010396431|nr:roundabout homolog 3-like isoform X2 [Ostrinia furnacalis]